MEYKIGDTVCFNMFVCGKRAGVARGLVVNTCPDGNLLIGYRYGAEPYKIIRANQKYVWKVGA